MLRKMMLLDKECLMIWIEATTMMLSERMTQVRSYDLNLVDRSDFIIAHLLPDVASWGSAEELVTAVRMKKPVLFLCKAESQDPFGSWA